MAPDLTPEIDAALDQMDALMARLANSRPKRPPTHKHTRMAFQACLDHLEDSTDPDAPKPVAAPQQPVVKFPAVKATVFLPRRQLGSRRASS